MWSVSGTVRIPAVNHAQDARASSNLPGNEKGAEAFAPAPGLFVVKLAKTS